MNKTNQRRLNDKELQDCESFRLFRISYQMNQKQWAEAIGISYGLVKRIEAHTIRCSEKTKAKIQNYIEQCPSPQDAPDLLGLEAHVLRDVFLTHMDHTPKKEAMTLSARCARKLQEILGYASSLESPSMQSTYYRYVGQLLDVLSLSTADAVPAINDGKDILNIKQGLQSVFTGKQITKFKHSGNVIISDTGEVSYQYSIFDMGLS